MRSTAGSAAVGAPGETADDVLAFARSAGWELSRPQLERRHRAGVIGRPQQVALGRGAGTVSTYPAGTKQQLVAALELQREHRSLSAVLWKMWIVGHDVSVPAIRSQLLEVADLHDRAAEWSKARGFGQNPLSNLALRTLRWIVRRFGALDPLDQVARRVESGERMETVVRVALDMSVGFYEEPHVGGPSDEEGSLLARALGLGELEESLAEMQRAGLVKEREEPVSLGEVTRAVGGDWKGALAPASDDDLRSARNHFVALRDGLRVVASEMQEIFGTTFGLQALVRLLTANGLAERVTVLCILKVEGSADGRIRGALDAFTDATLRWQDSQSPWLPVLRALRRVDALGPALAPKQLRRAALDNQFRARHRTSVNELWLVHRAEIEAALLGVKVPEAQPPFAR